MDDDVLTTLKIVIIGDSGVGKTNLLRRFTEYAFTSDDISTLATYSKETVALIHDDYVKLVIWDTVGYEAHRFVTPFCYADVHGVILMYDVSRYRTFTLLKHCMRKLRRRRTKCNVVKLIVGNKVDVENRQVSTEEAVEFARKHQALYLETSAKTRQGVDVAFLQLGCKIIETPDLWYEDESDDDLPSCRII